MILLPLSQNPDSVQVTFEKNAPRSFDLVLGADGLHSNVRKLVFGEESLFLRELGAYISIFTVPNHLGLDRQEIEYTEPGKLVYLFSSRGDHKAKAAFLFSSKPLLLNPRDKREHQLTVWLHEKLRQIFPGWWVNFIVQ